MFGGDPDNFNFPRYDLGLCVPAPLRERQARGDAGLSGLVERRRRPPAEPVFVPGNPATTERQLAVAQLGGLRDVALPILAVQEAELRGRLTQLGEQNAATARLVAAPLFEHENTLKVLQGRLAALRDPRVHGRPRSRDEADMKTRHWPPSRS